MTPAQYIAEITPKKQVVWRYDAPPGTEIHACQPIGLDKVLFIQNGLPPLLVVMNLKTKAVEVRHELPAESQTDPKSVHPQFRRVRMTAQGTYLVPFLRLGKVVEYNREFQEIWSYEIPTPWAAIRLKNGNTLITDEREKLTREVNPRKETLWELKPEDVPAEYRFLNTQTCTRLANGNTTQTTFFSRVTSINCAACPLPPREQMSRIGKNLARRRPCRSWMTPGFPKSLVSPSTEREGGKSLANRELARLCRNVGIRIHSPHW